LLLGTSTIGVAEPAGESVQSKKTALADLIKKAEKGDAEAQSELAWIYWFGLGVGENNFEANAWAKKGASKGNFLAEYVLASSLRVLEVEKDKKPWEKIYSELETKLSKYDLNSDPRLKLIHGVIIYSGYREDPDKGFSLILEAGDSGDPAAHAVLGQIYLDGEGVLKNTRLAHEWFEKSSKSDCVRALRELGILFYDGAQHIEMDQEKGLMYMERAVNFNDLESYSIVLDLYYLDEKYTKVINLAEKALAVASKNNQKQSIAVARILRVQGDTHFDNEAYKKALNSYLESISHILKHYPEYHADLGNLYWMAGLCHDLLNNDSDTRNAYDLAVSYLHKIQDPDDLFPFEIDPNRDLARVFYGLALGFLNNFPERISKALECAQQAANLYEKMDDTTPVELAEINTLLASIYFDLGSKSKSINHSRKAIKILEKAGEESLSAYRKHSFLCRSLGLISEAISYRKKALKLAQESQDVLEIVSNKAYQLDLEAKEREIGVESYKDLVHTLESSDLKDSETYITRSRLCSKIAEIYKDNAKYELAQQWAEKALKLSGDDDVSYNIAAYNLAPIYFDKGNRIKAQELAEQICENESEANGELHPENNVALTLLFKIYLRLGQKSKATKIASKLKLIEETEIADAFGVLRGEQRWEFVKRNFDFYAALAALEMNSELAEAILRFKGIGIASLIEDRRLFVKQDDPKLRGLIDEIADLQAGLIREQIESSVNKSNSENKTKHNNLIDAKKEKLTQVQGEIAGLLHNQTEIRPILQVNTFDVRSNLDPDSALIDYVTYNDFAYGNSINLSSEESDNATLYGAMIFTRKADPIWVPLGSAKEIEQLIDHYQPNSEIEDLKYIRVLNGLYSRLVLPCLDKIPSEIKTLIFSPDGKLNNLNLSVLMDSKGRFLCEEYSIKNVAAGRDTINGVIERKPEVPILAVYANPSFHELIQTKDNVINRSLDYLDQRTIDKLRSGLNFKPLDGAQKEAEFLLARAKTWNIKPEIHVGNQATESMLNQVQSPYILHLATHGFFLPDSGINGSKGSEYALTSPMHRSGLALAGAMKTLELWREGNPPRPENDGILTAAEAGLLNLDGTWLVSLSACETGKGEIVDGEGVMGLRRAFIHAGAQNVLMTLWPVSDRYTTDFMEAFYEEAMSVGDAPQALTDIQRDLLVKYREKFKGNRSAVRLAVQLAGPFIISFQGKP
jgi:CHAT domain-containing protein/TPR repeat protein